MSALSLQSSAPSLGAALADPAVRHDLQQALPGYLREQRWFAARSASRIDVHVFEIIPINPSASMVLVILDVTADDVPARYQLLLGAQPAGGGFAAADVLGDSASAVLALDAILDQPASSPLQVNRFNAIPCTGTARIPRVEQSNTSVIYGETCIMKLFRQLSPGRNPDVELTSWLSSEAAFDGVPSVVASAQLELPGFSTDSLIVQEFVPSNGDGWAWALTRAEEAFAAATVPGELSRWLATSDPGNTLERAADLGHSTARLHRALASATTPGMAPEPFTRTDWEDFLATLRVELADTLDLCRRQHPEAAASLEALEHAIPTTPTEFGLKTRVHGDLHLGQVLDAARGWIFVDFEGEPARPLAERVALQHPLVDVAGIVRSWDYAASVAGRDHPARREWASAVTGAFTSAYWQSTDGAPFLPSDTGSREALLRAFVMRKALYEVRYELGSRPDWVSIPLAALQHLAEDLP